MKKYLFANDQNFELDFALPAMAVTVVKVIESKSVDPGLYLFKIFRPIWDEESGVYGTVVTVSDSNNESIAASIGSGACEYQSISYGIRHLRRKILVTFSETDTLTFVGSNRPMTPREIIDELFWETTKPTFIIAPKGTRARYKIAEMKCLASDQKHKEKPLKICIYGPVLRNVTGWSCPIRINRELRIEVTGNDSLRSLIGGHVFARQWFSENFDDNWRFHHDSKCFSFSQQNEILMQPLGWWEIRSRGVLA